MNWIKLPSGAYINLDTATAMEAGKLYQVDDPPDRDGWALRKADAAALTAWLDRCSIDLRAMDTIPEEPE